MLSRRPDSLRRGIAGLGERTLRAIAIAIAITCGLLFRQDININLAPLAGSSYHGSAVITTTPDGYKLSITLAGLTPDSKHLINIHPGTCDAIDAGNGQDVGFLAADAAGSGTFETEYHSAYSVPSSGKVIAIHGDRGTPAAAGHYVCGAMPQ